MIVLDDNANDLHSISSHYIMTIINVDASDGNNNTNNNNDDKNNKRISSAFIFNKYLGE